MAEDVRIGQIWTRRRDGREVVITSHDTYWDDCQYRWLNGGGGGSIYADNLRKTYDLTSDATA